MFGIHCTSLLRWRVAQWVAGRIGRDERHRRAIDAAAADAAAGVGAQVGRPLAQEDALVVFYGELRHVARLRVHRRRLADNDILIALHRPE